MAGYDRDSIRLNAGLLKMSIAHRGEDAPTDPSSPITSGIESSPHDLASVQSLAQIFDAIGMALYLTDADGWITCYNAAAVDLWGWRPPIRETRWCGSPRLFRMDGAPLRPDEYPMALALREGRPIRNMGVKAERPDGSRVALLSYASPLRGRGGALLGGVNILVDLTEQKGGSARAPGATIAKTRFLAAMSHEFRTPIHGILGFSDLLADASASNKPFGPEQAGWIEDIKGAGLHLLDLVNDAIAFADASVAAARPMAGRRACRLRTIVSDVMSSVQCAFQARGVALALQGTDGNASAAIDPPALRQALLCVLREVVRHMPERGCVTIGWGTSQADGQAFITVGCPGMAVPPDLLEQLDTPFAGADRDTYSRGLEGAGLSVATASEMLRGYNGQLSILGGRDGVPATFRLAVPIAPEGDADIASGPAAAAGPPPTTSLPPALLHPSFSLAQVVAAARDIILVTAADLGHPGPTIVYVNPAFTTLTGYAAEEVLGRSPRFLQGPGTDLEVLYRLSEDLRAGREARATVLNYTRSGEPYWIEMHIVPLRDGRGRVSHYAAIERVVGGDTPVPLPGGTDRTFN